MLSIAKTGSKKQYITPQLQEISAVIPGLSVSHATYKPISDSANYRSAFDIVTVVDSRQRCPFWKKLPFSIAVARSQVWTATRPSLRSSPLGWLCNYFYCFKRLLKWTCTRSKSE